MGEDPGVSEIKETIVDVKQRPPVLEYPIFMVKEENRGLIILEHCFKHLDESEWRERVGRPGESCSGFYRSVPSDIRMRAGSEEAAGMLYDPKHVDFTHIHSKFEEYTGRYPDGSSNVESKVGHYCYHLRSYVQRMGKKDLKSLMRELNREYLESFPPFEYDIFMEWVGLPLLVGTSFLIDLFQRTVNGELSATDDPECAHLWVSDLWADLLLLENQIPLLMRVHDKNTLGSILSYFEDFIPLNAKEFSDQVLNYKGGRAGFRFWHLLHLIHDMLLPTLVLGSSVPYLAPLRMKPVPTATRLQQAGITFKPVDRAGLMVEFKRGVLMLPRLHITNCTQKVIMNLIAWETLFSPSSNYINNYIVFMDHLINTPKDVDILIQSGVLEHSLATDEEVAKLFNALGNDHFYVKEERQEYKRYDIFPKLSSDMNKHCRSRSNMWWANLMQDYFKSPWTIISVVAALLLILLTVAQTFFSAYSYFRPPQ